MALAIRHGSNPRLFARRPSSGVRAFFCIVLAIVLMVLDSRGAHLQHLRQTLSVVVYPIRAASDLPFQFLTWTRESLAARERLLARNRQLEEQNLRLSGRLQRLTALETENTRLRALMESGKRLQQRMQVAEILRVDLDPFRHQIVINKGLRDGVYAGQPLLDAEGVFGQVVHPGQLSSEALLITDPSHALPVTDNRNGLRTIAVGTGELDRLSLPYLPNSADIQAGDLLVTSGLGGRFPPGYPVATVTAVNRDPSATFADVSARPLAALDRSQEVLLVWNTTPPSGSGEAGQATPADSDPSAADSQTVSPDTGPSGAQP